KLIYALCCRASSSSSSIEPLQPINRLRISPHESHSRMCSRCSSLLTLASSSRYSLNSSTGGFIPVPPEDPLVLCKLCLIEVPSMAIMHIQQCDCTFCTECMRAYVEFEIAEGAYEISCPDAQCPSQGVLQQEEIKRLAGSDLLEKHKKYRLNRGWLKRHLSVIGVKDNPNSQDAGRPRKRHSISWDIVKQFGCLGFDIFGSVTLRREELLSSIGVNSCPSLEGQEEVELDKSRTWCPKAGCETVCSLCPTNRCSPQNVYCPTCGTDFCSNCKLEWHEGLSCEENSKQLTKEGRAEEPGIPFDSDLIKCCPMCNVPIEKDEGSAFPIATAASDFPTMNFVVLIQKKEDDFLLRHYDKGPCKNKLGHSRASVIWHRTQVIGIFAGFGILLLVASPLLLLAAPCIVCCKCRFCNSGTTKLDNEDVKYQEKSRDVHLYII
ncbi:hypothetical protein NQ317_010416, partial [Molorchus minor]